MLYISAIVFSKFTHQHFYIAFLCLYAMGCPLALFAQKDSELALSTLSKQADSLYYHKRFKEALTIFDQMQQVYKVQREWQQQAACLGKMGNCCRLLSKFNEGQMHFDSAIAIMEGKVGFEKTYSVFYLYLDYGELMERAEKFEKALSIYNKALQLAKERCEPKALVVAHIYRALGGVYRYIGKLEESIVYLEKAKWLYEEMGASMENKYKLYNIIFSYYYYKSDIETALDYLLVVDKWLSTFDKIPLHINAEFIYNNLGVAYTEMGNYPLAAFYNQKALDICKERFGEKYYLNVFILQTIGAAQMDNEDTEAAAQTFKEALRISKLIWRDGHSINLKLNLFLVESLERSGKESEAADYWNVCSSLSHSTKDTINLLYLKAEIRAKQGRWAEAAALYKQLDEVIERLDNNEGAFLGMMYLNTGKMLYHLQNYEEALYYLDKGIAQYPISIATLDKPLKEPVNQSSLVTPFLFAWKAKTLLAQWKKHTAAHALLESAWSNVKTSNLLLEEVKLRLHGLGENRYSWLVNAHDNYGVSIEIAQLLFRQKRDPFYSEQAFLFSEKDRALALLENLRLIGTERFQPIPTPLQQRERELTRRVVRGEIQYATEAIFDAEAYQDLLSAKRDFTDLLDTLARLYPNYYAFKYDLKPAPVEDIRQRLSADAILASYFLNQATNTLYIFAIDKKTGLHLHTTPLPASLSSDVAQLAQLQRSVGLVRTEKRQQFIQLNHAFYKTLIGPLEGLLADKKRLIVVANDVLYYLPFEALLRSDANKPFDQLDFLLRRCEVSYHYSASLYAKSKELAMPAAKPKVLAFAPSFSSTAEVKAVEDEQSREWNWEYNPLSVRLRALPYSVQEVQTVLDSFSAVGSVGLVKEQATEAALKRALGSPYDVLHFATHSFANVEQPSLSGISCGQGMAQDSTEDGTLHVNELYQMPLSADLVVLSSCESGVGHSVGNEGPLGINRAFAYAGVPNVLFSLWKVNDKAGSALMVEFYRQLNAGKTYSAALRAAKLRLLSNPAFAPPNFWSGFLLVGN